MHTLQVEQQGLTPRSPSSSQELATSPSKPPIGPRASRSFAQGRGLRQQDSYSSVHAGFSEGDLEVSILRACGCGKSWVWQEARCAPMNLARCY